MTSPVGDTPFTNSTLEHIRAAAREAALAAPPLSDARLARLRGLLCPTPLPKKRR